MKPEDITAWALNELSPEERTAMEAELAATPQAQQRARETQAFCALLSEHLVNEDAAFSPEQRERLQALELPAPENVVAFSTAPETPRMNGRAFHAKVTAARERAATKSPVWLRIVALAACLMLALFVVDQSRTLPAPVVASRESPATAESVRLAPSKSTTDLRRATPAPAPAPPVAPVSDLAMKTITSVPASPGQAAPLDQPEAGKMLSADIKPSGNIVLKSEAGHDHDKGLSFNTGPVAAVPATPMPQSGPSSPGAANVALSIPSEPAIAPPASQTQAGLVKAGAGTLVLNGANTYSGGVTVAAGTLRIQPSASAATIRDGAGSIALGDSVLKDTPGSGGSLATMPAKVPTSNITINGGASLTMAGSSGQVVPHFDSNTTFSGVISGTALDLNGYATSATGPSSLSDSRGTLQTMNTSGAASITMGGGSAANSFVKSGSLTENVDGINGVAATSTNGQNLRGYAGVGTTTVTAGTSFTNGLGFSSGGQATHTDVGDASTSSQYMFYGSARDHVRTLKPGEVSDEPWGESVAVAPVPEAATAKAAPSGTARYARIVENPFQSVQSQPLSTFSIDVDTASYANVRRFLNAGRLPPPDAVRLEELVNYFPYDYEQPGKDQPFSVQVDLAEAPWAPQHRLARVSIKGRDVGQERPAANFVFLIDVSGSMDSPERLPLVKQSLEMLTEQLRDDDHVSIVTYAGECRVALESTSGSQKRQIMRVIHGLHAGGSTNGESGIMMAYEQSAANFIKDGINRIVLCTDGDFNVGISDTNQLQKLIKAKAKGGTFLSVLGFGTDNLQDHTMEVLADNGNGNYAYIDSLGEARKVLVEQMRGTLITIAKDVKIQVEFNPAQVASYRLIGYEKRMLAAKDFNNDKKDAGEIGAGHTVTAFYELVPAGLPMANGALADVDHLKYQPQAASRPQPLPTLDAKAPERLLETANDETMTVKLRYKAPDGQISKLIEVPVRDAKKTLQDSPRDFRFATAVAGFGMLLRDSEHVEDFGFEAVRKLALSGKGEDALGYRGEFIQLIDKAKGLKGR